MGNPNVPANQPAFIDDAGKNGADGTRTPEATAQHPIVMPAKIIHGRDCWVTVLDTRKSAAADNIPPVKQRLYLAAMSMPLGPNASPHNTINAVIGR